MLEIKQEQLLHIDILPQIEVEVMLARTYSGATRFDVSWFCAVRRVKEVREQWQGLEFVLSIRQGDYDRRSL